MFTLFNAHSLGNDIPDNETLSGIPNTEQIKRFVGKVVKKITDGLYEIISNRARDLNIYTYELRCDSKAMKVFMGERLDFLDEDKIRREILLYLISSKADSDHIKLLRDFEPLGLDPGLDPAYIKSLINHSPEHLAYISEKLRLSMIMLTI